MHTFPQLATALGYYATVTITLVTTLNYIFKFNPRDFIILPLK